MIRSGIKIALIGKTNVGKSSLMNKLAERDISIVSAIPGTSKILTFTLIIIHTHFKLEIRWKLA